MKYAVIVLQKMEKLKIHAFLIHQLIPLSRVSRRVANTCREYLDIALVRAFANATAEIGYRENNVNPRTKAMLR